MRPRLAQAAFPDLAMAPDAPRQRTEALPDAGLEARFQKQIAVLQLINAYRFRGHRQADLDPLRQYRAPGCRGARPRLSRAQRTRPRRYLNTGSLFGAEHATLGEILDIGAATVLPHRRRRIHAY